jgi:hypothetical protein
MRERTTPEETKNLTAVLRSSPAVQGYRASALRRTGRRILFSAFVAVALVACSGTGVQNTGSAGSGGATPAAPPPPGGDTSPPNVDIASPANGSSSASQAVTLSGTASDDVAVTQVTWRNTSTGVTGTASGTTSWTATGVPLRVGSNTLRVTARDGAGNTQNTQITVTYAPPTQNTAVLNWDDNNEPDLAGYRVYYGTSPSNYLQPKGQGLVATDTTYTVAGLSGGVRYYFAVTSYDGSGNESNYSLEVSKDFP